MEEVDQEYRKHIRFNQDAGAVAEIDLESDESQFTPSLSGLLVNDSFGGCAVVVVTDEIMEFDQPCAVRFSDLSPFRGRIIWTQSLDDRILKLGIKYID